MELKIGKVIAEARRYKGLTQEGLANTIGVSSAAVSKWETAASYPDITLLPPLARVLGLTLDELMDFHGQPSKDEVQEITEHLGRVFDTQGYTAGMSCCEEALREYPSCGLLKMNIGGLYVRYISMAIGGGSDADGAMDAMCQKLTSLLEQAEGEVHEANELQAARLLRISSLIMLGRYEEAEQLLDSLPGDPQLNSDAMYISLYMAKGELDKAERLSAKMLLRSVTNAGTTLTSLCGAAIKQGDMERAHKFADAYTALMELFDMDRSSWIYLQLQLALEENDIRRALDLTRQYVDARLASSYDYSGNPFFSLLQTRVPSPAEIMAMNRVILRSLESEPFRPLQGEPQFEDAVSRLRESLKSEKQPE